jgi:signal transduction histidine kinase
MEIRALWFERQGTSSDAALAKMLHRDGVDVVIVPMRTLDEVESALTKEDFRCAIVVHEPGSEEWRDVLKAFSAARVAIPVVLLLGAESDKLAREALLCGAWHAVPKHHEALCAAALERSIQHALATEECSAIQQALKRAEEILEKNQRSIALGVLLGSIAHEINNPLEGIANLIYLAQRSVTDPATVQSCLDMSEAELSRVSEITKQMLSFHRGTRAAQVVSVAEMLDGILTLFTAKLRERKITLHRQYDAAGWMEAHAGELRQASVNLIANAIDAMEDGGRLTLRVREHGGASPRLCVSIGDSGKGMPQNVIKHLGELFLTTKGESGTGIGLWVTRRILRRHGGGLRVYSSERPGRAGTVFRLCFPPPYAKLKGNTRVSLQRSDRAEPELDEWRRGIRPRRSA